MASTDGTDRLPHDQAFKAIFSHPRMIADAVRGYAVRPIGPLHPSTIAALDFATVERLPTEWISRGFRRRQGDQVWRVRFRGADDRDDPYAHLLILVEFQSSANCNVANFGVGGYAGEPTDYEGKLSNLAKKPCILRFRGYHPFCHHDCHHREGKKRWRKRTD